MTSSVRIFRPSVPEGFEWVLPTVSDYDVFMTLADPPSAVAWEPIQMMVLSADDRGRPDKHAYLPWLGRGVLVLRDEAIDVVGPILQPHGELLPLACNEARLALFSAPKLKGVLDQDRSDLVRFDSGRIMHLRAPVFRHETLGQTQAFKLVEMPRGSLYLGEHLVDALCATGMTSGTEFTVIN